MTLAPSGGLVRDLTAVVQISALPMFNTRQDLAFGSTIRSEFVGHDHPGHVAQTLQQLAKETFGRFRVPSALDQHIEYIPVLINGPPEVVQFASDADKDLIQEPYVAGLWPATLEGLGIDPSEAQAPFADGLIADHHTSRRKDQFDFTQAEAEAVVEPNRLVDDFGRKTEAAVRIEHRAHACDAAIDRSPSQPDSTRKTHRKRILSRLS
jgi:hypothetical protein